MNKLSAVIITNKNQQDIERCLKSLEFCEEIIVVEDGEIRNSKFEIPACRQADQNKSQIRIFQRKFDGDFAAQRNFGMEKASGEWILFIDSDEIVSEELAEEIKEVMSYGFGVRGGINAFYIRRRDFFLGKELKYGETSSARNKGIIRLVKKGSGRFEGKVHERFMIHDSRFKNKTLNSYLNHYSHQTVREFIESVNFYSSLRAGELYKQGKKINIFEIVLYPPGKFLLTYFIRLGFLDGPAGFVYSFMMSFHSFLVRIKLYQKIILLKGLHARD